MGMDQEHSIYRRAIEELERQRAQQQKKKKKRRRRRPLSMPPNTDSPEIFIDGASRHRPHTSSRRNIYVD